MPQDYSQGFVLTDPVGNNAFSYEERSALHVPQLFVPALIDGGIGDVALGDQVVFEEYDEGLISCSGLDHFIHTKQGGVDVYIFDNHNHAFYFWMLHHSGVAKSLVHIDQHSDMRVPDLSLEQFIVTQDLGSHTPLQQAYMYTNFHLNIGNFIVPAVDAGIVADVIQVTGSVREVEPPKHPYILDIDLDYFAPEMDFLGRADRMDFIRSLIPDASLITIATSPYFLDQRLVGGILEEIFSD